MGLATYNKKRDFKKTAEPPGKLAKSKSGHRYLIQKHAASRLHYDFRLELDGVLLSWAVPKGPSLNPKDRRLAVQTEDHPLAYGDFEGTIPAGEYGGGTVMLWDTGTWSPEEDVRTTLKKGRLNFTLNGGRLKGGWLLTRMHTRDGKDNNWLLIKQDDKYANKKGEAAVEKYLTSVTTDRPMDEIAKGTRVWGRKGAEDLVTETVKKTAKKIAKTAEKITKKITKTKFPFATPPKAKKSTRPVFIPPQLATLEDDPPNGDGWFHEIKYDGYRVQLVKNGKQAIAYTRRGKDWSARFRKLLDDLEALPVDSAIIDGEVVVLNNEGVSEFQLLQNALDADREQDLTYFAFDLLHCNGYDLRKAPLEERKAILKKLLETQHRETRLRYSDHIEGSGDAVFSKSCSMSLEGIISKRAKGAYNSGRSPDWLKSKCSKRQEFVIGGFVKPKNDSRGVGSLLLGYYQGNQFTYAGKVGTGFTDKSGSALRKKLDRLVQKGSPFADISREAKKDAHWVAPEIVGEIEFTEWTKEGALRHPAFLALREDKKAKDVVREEAHDDVEVPPAPSGEAPILNDKPAPSIHFTSPDKVLYPGQGLTKLDLASYYHQVADWILPHLVGRPISLVRCPEGQSKQCFFQRHSSKGTPEDIGTVDIADKDGKVSAFLTIKNEAGLLSLVQIGVLEIHPWGAHGDNPEKPDLMILDMDPAEDVPFHKVVAAVEEARARLKKFKLESFVKTTGGKGLHVVVPLARKQSWETMKSFAKNMALQMEADAPNAYISKMSKAARKGKIYIDYLRNERSASAVAPYSARARPNAPVAMPVRWDELSKLTSGNQYRVDNALFRLAGLKSDPWEGIYDLKQWISA